MNLTSKQKEIINFSLDILIIIDIILLLIALLYTGFENNAGIIVFDFIVCILLLIEFTINCSKSTN